MSRKCPTLEYAGAIKFQKFLNRLLLLFNAWIRCPCFDVAGAHSLEFTLGSCRYSVVLFAGIAAEALIYGEVQGGESDENLFKSVVGQLQPSWSPAKVTV